MLLLKMFDGPDQKMGIIYILCTEPSQQGNNMVVRFGKQKSLFTLTFQMMTVYYNSFYLFFSLVLFPFTTIFLLALPQSV